MQRTFAVKFCLPGQALLTLLTTQPHRLMALTRPWKEGGGVFKLSNESSFCFELPLYDSPPHSHLTL